MVCLVRRWFLCWFFCCLFVRACCWRCFLLRQQHSLCGCVFVFSALSTRGSYCLLCSLCFLFRRNCARRSKPRCRYGKATRFPRSSWPLVVTSASRSSSSWRERRRTRKRPISKACLVGGVVGGESVVVVVVCCGCWCSGMWLCPVLRVGGGSLSSPQLASVLLIHPYFLFSIQQSRR